MIQIVIADDHRLVAEGVAQLIHSQTSARVVAICGTLESAVSFLAEHHPDILLLDVALPDGDGIDAVGQLRRQSPQTRIIIFTMYAEPAVIKRALNNNVEGYLLKSCSADELKEAIETVAKGAAYICEEARQIMCCGQECPAQLTAREREILRLIVDGYSQKEIADQLCLAFETVHSYTKYIRQKLGSPNTATLVRMAIEQHLV